MNRNKRVVYILAIVALTLACAPLLPQPVTFPTNGPGAIDTFVAATYGAAATQTAVFAPTSTSTATITPTASNTPTVTPLPTNTIIFRLPATFTPVKIATSSTKKAATATTTGGGGGGGGGTTANYKCSVVSVTPANNTIFSPNAPFTAQWKVKNIGDTQWDENSVDYLYINGASMHTQALYDLTANVAVNASITLSVSMQAPSSPGTYSATWSMRAGATRFCSLKVTIKVQ